MQVCVCVCVCVFRVCICLGCVCDLRGQGCECVCVCVCALVREVRWREEFGGVGAQGQCSKVLNIKRCSVYGTHASNNPPTPCFCLSDAAGSAPTSER